MTLRVLLFQESDGEQLLWVAQCLEHDINAQGHLLSDAVRQWNETWRVYQAALSAAIFVDVILPPTAPEIYHHYYDQSYCFYRLPEDNIPEITYRVYTHGPLELFKRTEIPVGD